MKIGAVNCSTRALADVVSLLALTKQKNVAARKSALMRTFRDKTNLCFVASIYIPTVTAAKSARKPAITNGFQSISLISMPAMLYSAAQATI